MTKVLVAEDEKPIAKALTLKLQHAGFEVTTVYNGEEAVNELEKEPYDLALFDLIMPGVDGFKALKMLKEKDIKLPVIVLSNLSQQGDIEKARDLGARDYFIKSNTPVSEIVDYVQRVLKDEQNKQ